MFINTYYSEYDIFPLIDINELIFIESIDSYWDKHITFTIIGVNELTFVKTNLILIKINVLYYNRQKKMYKAPKS